LDGIAYVHDSLYMSEKTQWEKKWTSKSWPIQPNSCVYHYITPLYLKEYEFEILLDFTVLSLKW